MKILAIDPGNVETGYAVLELPELKLYEFGKVKNEELLEKIRSNHFADVDKKVQERIVSYGMSVGASVFETCIWIGRFYEALQGTDYISRVDEKMTLCHSMKAKDCNIRQALIDRYAQHDLVNGKGTKKQPDIFYGVSKDVWSAIAVGVTYYEKIKGEKTQ